MVWLKFVLLAAIGLVLLRFAWNARYDFILHVRDGRVRIVRGRLPRSLTAEIEKVCAGARIERASIKGFRRGGAVSLVFSRNVPSSCRQQLRNLWALPR